MYRLAFIFLLFSLVFVCACTEKEQTQITDDLPLIELEIAPTAMLKIRHKREKALRQGLLVSKKKDYVAARIKYKGRNLAAELRLKGDWLDHLKGNKWSWRVKLADSCQLDGMQRFSLQHPRVRSYLDEWVFHRLLDQEDVMNTKYTFVRLLLNGQDKGIYALEEHFAPAIQHRFGRPEAPILKFDEDGFWQAQAIHQRTGKNLTHFMPVFESAEITAFQTNKTLKNTYNKNCFQAGKKHLSAMRLASEPASTLVDVDKVARWFALSDLVNSYHSLRWHNMRFYYHPIRAKLEPIVYDAYSSQGAYRWFRKPLLGSYNEQADTVFLAEEYLSFSLFNDPQFRQSYYHYLQAYAKDEFLKSFEQSIKKELRYYEEILQTEFKNYQYDYNQLGKEQARLQKELLTYEPYPPAYQYYISPFLFDSCRSDLPIPKVALKVDQVDNRSVALSNYFCQPIKVKAVGSKKTDQRAIAKLELPAFSSQTWPPDTSHLKINLGEQYFYYEVAAQDNLFRQKRSIWPASATASFIQQDTLQIDAAFMQQKGTKIIVPKGKHTLSQRVNIPNNYSLEIQAGAQINMLNEAAIVVYGALRMQGEPNDEVYVYSADASARGVYVLQADEKVELSYVKFEQLSDQWGPLQWFKGAVTIFESDVYMKHVSFEGIDAEDGLNVVNGLDVHLEQLEFKNCTGDALDLDYCQANLNDLSFEQIGGDGLDCSASKIKANDLHFEQISDKGISVGEASSVEIQNADVKQANLGIGVKDASVAYFNHLVIENCQTGVAVFNKKPIFTAASCKITTLEHKDLKNIYALEQQHVLELGQKAMPVTHAKFELSAIFYPAIAQ